MQAELLTVDEHASATSAQSSRWRRVAEGLETHHLEVDFATDYATMTYRGLFEKYKEHFDEDTSELQAKSIIANICDYFEIPRKRPGTSRTLKGRRQVTPSTLDQAFKPGESVPPDQALQALATALLPYLRDALLDDQETAIRLVRTARGTNDG